MNWWHFVKDTITQRPIKVILMTFIMIIGLGSIFIAVAMAG